MKDKILKFFKRYCNWFYGISIIIIVGIITTNIIYAGSAFVTGIFIGKIFDAI